MYSLSLSRFAHQFDCNESDGKCWLHTETTTCLPSTTHIVENEYVLRENVDNLQTNAITWCPTFPFRECANINKLPTAARTFSRLSLIRLSEPRTVCRCKNRFSCRSQSWCSMAIRNRSSSSLNNEQQVYFKTTKQPRQWVLARDSSIRVWKMKCIQRRLCVGNTIHTDLDFEDLSCSWAACSSSRILRRFWTSLISRNDFFLWHGMHRRLNMVWFETRHSSQTNLHLEFCFRSFGVPLAHFDFLWQKVNTSVTATTHSFSLTAKTYFHRVFSTQTVVIDLDRRRDFLHLCICNYVNRQSNKNQNLQSMTAVRLDMMRFTQRVARVCVLFLVIVGAVVPCAG